MDSHSPPDQGTALLTHDNATLVRTGFHAIEETLRRIGSDRMGHTGRMGTEGACLYYSKALPRVKRIIEQAKKAGVNVVHTSEESLDKQVASLPQGARDHRGVLLVQEGGEQESAVDLASWLATCPDTACVVMLDEITDPHNVGAILRSCDQFAVQLVVLPKRRAATAEGSETVLRASAGASSWVKCAQVANLASAARRLKTAGFWLWAASANGEPLASTVFAKRTCIVMGSEGKGISRLLSEECDQAVAVETAGHIDSLNVSVAAGILLHAVFLQQHRHD